MNRPSVISHKFKPQNRLKSQNFGSFSPQKGLFEGVKQTPIMIYKNEGIINDFQNKTPSELSTVKTNKHKNSHLKRR